MMFLRDYLVLMQRGCSKDKTLKQPYLAHECATSKVLIENWVASDFCHGLAVTKFE